MTSKKYLFPMFLLLLTAACSGKSLETASSAVNPAQEVYHQTPLQVTDEQNFPDVREDLDAASRLWKGAVCSNPAQAHAQLDRVLAKHPRHAQALALRGLARSQQEGQREEAFDDLTTAIRLTPTAQFYAWRGLASMRGGNARAALSDARYALRKDAEQPVAHMVLGMAALEQGRVSEACPALNRACQAGECQGLEEARAGGQCLR